MSPNDCGNVSKIERLVNLIFIIEIHANKQKHNQKKSSKQIYRRKTNQKKQKENEWKTTKKDDQRWDRE